jgi:hypothetical protein
LKRLTKDSRAIPHLKISSLAADDSAACCGPRNKQREQAEREKARRKKKFEPAEALMARVYDQHGLSQDEHVFRRRRAGCTTVSTVKKW